MVAGEGPEDAILPAALSRRAQGGADGDDGDAAVRGIDVGNVDRDSPSGMHAMVGDHRP
ncbi:MAG: hypothetical protein R3D02_11880 [Hyphomicrobiales bacterium]